jgi:hypothetical protein
LNSWLTSGWVPASTLRSSSNDAGPLATSARRVRSNSGSLSDVRNIESTRGLAAAPTWRLPSASTAAEVKPRNRPYFSSIALACSLSRAVRGLAGGSLSISLISAADARWLSAVYLPIARSAATWALISFRVTGRCASSISASSPSGSLASPSASAALAALSTEWALTSSTSDSARLR